MSIALSIARRLPFYYGWIIVGVALVTMGIGTNSRTLFSLLLPPILEETGWSRELGAGIFSFGFAVSMGTAPVVGWLMDRYGPSFVLPLGAWLLAGGFVLAIGFTEAWHLYFTLGGLVVGCSVALAFIGHGAFLPNWFERQRGLAMGIGYSGLSVGALFLFPWMQSIIDESGWRTACWEIAFLLLVVVLPLNLVFLRRHPAELGLRPDGDAAHGLVHAAPHAAPSGASDVESADTPGAPTAKPDPDWTAIDWTVGRAIRTRRYWYLFGAFFTALFAWYLIQVHQAVYLVDVGFSPELAAWSLAIVGMTGVGGLLGLGYLSDRIGREWCWTLSCVGYLISYPLLLVLEHSQSIVIVYIMAAAQGMLGFGMAPIHSAAASDIFQGRHYGAIFGTLSFSTGLGASTGPWLGGLIHDVTGSYAFAFVLGTVLALASMVFMWLASPGRVRPVRGVVERSRRN